MHQLYRACGRPVLVDQTRAATPSNPLPKLCGLRETVLHSRQNTESPSPGSSDAMAFAMRCDNYPPFAAEQRGQAQPVVFLVITPHEDQLRRRKFGHLFGAFRQSCHLRSTPVGVQQVAHKRNGSGTRSLLRADQFREQGSVMMRIGRGKNSRCGHAGRRRSRFL